MFSTQKVAKALLEKITDEGIKQVRHIDLASSLGLSVKTIEREIKDFKKRKIISGKRGFYCILDRRLLERASDERYGGSDEVVTDSDLLDFLSRKVALEIFLRKVFKSQPQLEHLFNEEHEKLKSKISTEFSRRKRRMYASKPFILFEKRILDREEKKGQETKVTREKKG